MKINNENKQKFKMKRSTNKKCFKESKSSLGSGNPRLMLSLCDW